MSHQKMSHKKNKRVVLLVAIIAVVATVSAGFTSVLSLFASNPTQENDSQNPDSQTPTTDNSGEVEVGKELRTKDNTGCVNPPNGPKIC